MTVSLNPPSLGHVEIQVTTRGKNVEIQMRSETNLAKTTLESQLGELRHSMQVQDLNLSKLEVQVSHDLGRMDMERNQGNPFLNMGSHGNPYQQSHGFQRNAESPWHSQQSHNPTARAGLSAVSSVDHNSRNAARTPGRVDIRI